jgi:predicted porin
MILKKTVLALAVAGITAAPMIASADGSVYGNVRYGIQTQDAGGTSERVTQFRNFGSRFGIKGETDLGNGMTGFGQWETQMVQNPANDNVRALKVGIKGDFGQLYLGDDIDHAWDTFMSTDDTWWFGGSADLQDGVQNNALTYLGSFGAVQLGVTAAMNVQANNADEESLDAVELVVAFDAGPVNIAVGMHDENAKVSANDPEAVIGFVVKGNTSGFGYALDYQQQDAIGASTADRTSIQLQGTYSNFILQYGTNETDGSSVEPSQLTFGYTQNLGPDTLIWYEYNTADSDVPGANSVDTIAAVLKYNIL